MVALIGMKLFELTRFYLIIEVATGNLFNGEVVMYLLGEIPPSYFNKIRSSFPGITIVYDDLQLLYCYELLDPS